MGPRQALLPAVLSLYAGVPGQSLSLARLRLSCFSLKSAHLAGRAIHPHGGISFLPIQLGLQLVPLHTRPPGVRSSGYAGGAGALALSVTVQPRARGARSQTIAAER